MGFPTDAFFNFVSNAPLANPLGASDMVPIIQGGVTKRVSPFSFPAVAALTTFPETIITAGATYNATVADCAIFVRKSPGSPTTINLPSNPGQGRPFIIGDLNGDAANNFITVGNATIDGQSGFILALAWQCIFLLSTGNGNEWKMISKLMG